MVRDKKQLAVDGVLVFCMMAVVFIFIAAAALTPPEETYRDDNVVYAQSSDSEDMYTIFTVKYQENREHDKSDTYEAMNDMDVVASCTTIRISEYIKSRNATHIDNDDIQAVASDCEVEHITVKIKILKQKMYSTPR